MHGLGPFIGRRSHHALRVPSLAVAVLVVGARPVAAGNAGSTAPTIAYSFDLPGGQTAKVFTNGVAAVFSKDRRKVEFRAYPVTPRYDEAAGQTGLPDKGQLIADLAAGAKALYADGRVLVVFASGVTGTSDVLSGQGAAFTNDSTTNAALASLGVDRSERLFRKVNRDSLAVMHANAQAALGVPLVDFSNAYRLHLNGASVRQAVTALLQSPTVVYASPAFGVSSSQPISIRIPAGTVQPFTVGGGKQPPSAAGVPSNFALASSAQSLLNAPGTDAAAAFDEIDRQFHQLPGQGEIITNVSLGDLDDAGVVNNFNDPCGFYATVFGPTTVVIGGQRYLNWPSMPLIPTYTSNQSGQLSGSGEVCGVDPFLGEVGLDFSMMAPLPHAQQRAGEVGSGLTDLLGIAPGASYRLVVPAPEGSFVTISDVDGSFLGAAMQSPPPNVITASLGFAVDQFGFSGRYLEDDPLTEAIIAGLVQQNIVVTVSSGDGLRTFTNAAVAPSGGSAPTLAIGSGGTPSDLKDVAFSGAPPRDFDSGARDGGSGRGRPAGGAAHRAPVPQPDPREEVSRPDRDPGPHGAAIGREHQRRPADQPAPRGGETAAASRAHRHPIGRPRGHRAAAQFQSVRCRVPDRDRSDEHRLAGAGLLGRRDQHRSQCEGLDHDRPGLGGNAARRAVRAFGGRHDDRVDSLGAPFARANPWRRRVAAGVHLVQNRQPHLPGQRERRAARPGELRAYLWTGGRDHPRLARAARSSSGERDDHSGDLRLEGGPQRFQSDPAGVGARPAEPGNGIHLPTSVQRAAEWADRHGPGPGERAAGRWDLWDQYLVREREGVTAEQRLRLYARRAGWLCAPGGPAARPERLRARPLPRGPLQRLVPTVLGRLRNANC